jgi:hypothetical protein
MGQAAAPPRLKPYKGGHMAEQRLVGLVGLG